MNSRFILITTAAILLAGCDRRSAEAEAAKAADIAVQRQAEQAANDKIRLLEDRLNAADQQKAADREAELARVKAELEQIKKDKELAAERIRALQIEAAKPAPVAEAPARDADEPRNEATHANLERIVEEEEDREPVYVGRVVPEAQRVTTVESFYEPLDQYGDWIQTDDYGYVFRPEVATRTGWRPYTDGHWVHTNYGWTWDSNEDFGWATYHYGRWTRVARAGWVWVPGREWGPGWVSWRRGADHCGWAPLPPESRARFSFTATVDRDYDIGPAAYVFIALSNFGARSYAPVIERPEQNVTIINKTVNITNITYNNTTNNTAVYNGGPSLAVMRARSKQPVENVNVNFAPRNPAAAQTKIANTRQGDTLQVASAPPPAAATVAPPRVKERLGKPKEDKGWEGVDPAQAQKVKQNIAATSTERPKRPRPAVGVVDPGVPPKPAAPPAVVAPAPATPPAQVPPKPEMPARPAVVDRPRTLDPDAAKPRPAAELPPRPDKPAEPDKPVVTAPPKPRPVDPAPPKPAADITPKVDPSEEPKKRGDNEPRRVRVVEDPAAPQPIRVVPRQPETPPVTPDSPKPPAPPEAPPRQPVEPPAKVKPQADAPNRVRPAKPDRPETDPAADRRAKPERDRVVAPPERRAPAPVTQPFIQNEQPPDRKVAPPQRPPEAVRPPEPPVSRPANPDRPAAEPAPERRGKPERVRATPAEKRAPAPATQPFIQNEQPPMRRVAPPQRPPEAVRPPEPPVNRPAAPDVQRARERVERQPAAQPAVQRAAPPQPQARPQQPGKPQPSAEESDKKKKKKDGEQ